MNSFYIVYVIFLTHIFKCRKKDTVNNPVFNYRNDWFSESYCYCEPYAVIYSSNNVIFLKLEDERQLSIYLWKSIAPQWWIKIPTNQNKKCSQEGKNNWTLLAQPEPVSL